MKNFTVGGKDYQSGPLNVFDQNHVARKLGSVLIFLGSMKANPDADVTPETRAKNYARAMVASSASLPNEDIDFVLGVCLAVVQRKETGGWAAIRASNGGLMFKDIDLQQMMEIVWNVLDDHKLIDFFYVAPSSSSEDLEQGRPSNSSNSETAKATS